MTFKLFTGKKPVGKIKASFEKGKLTISDNVGIHTFDTTVNFDRFQVSTFNEKTIFKQFYKLIEGTKTSWIGLGLENSLKMYFGEIKIKKFKSLRIKVVQNSSYNQHKKKENL
jgi:hypothetical protein